MLELDDFRGSRVSREKTPLLRKEIRVARNRFLLLMLVLLTLLWNILNMVSGHAKAVGMW
jgi:hypothetical protein